MDFVSNLPIELSPKEISEHTILMLYSLNPEKIFRQVVVNLHYPDLQPLPEPT